MSVPERSERVLVLGSAVKISIQLSWTDLCVADSFLLVAISARGGTYELVVAKICLQRVDRWRASNRVRASKCQKDNQNIFRLHRVFLPIQSLSARLSAVGI